MKKLLLTMYFMMYVCKLQTSELHSSLRVVCFSNYKDKEDSFLAYTALEEFGENLDEYRRLYAKNNNYNCGRMNLSIRLACNLYAINQLSDTFEESRILCKEAYKNEVHPKDQMEVLTADSYKDELNKFIYLWLQSVSCDDML